MKNYLQESISKFRKDAFSKVIYDVLKWLIISAFLFVATKLLPVKFSLSKAVFSNITLSVYWFILILLALIILTIIVFHSIYRKKYNKILSDNFTDELTGLKNYKALKEHLTEKLARIKNTEDSLSLIIIDVDDFKEFNTSEGYNTADKILKKIGELLANDKRATDETFRQFLRGDEFLVVATETNLHGAFLAAERKRKLIQKTDFSIDGKLYQVTVSCGVTEFNKATDDFSSLTDRVQMALNQAKAQKGKNCSKSIM